MPKKVPSLEEVLKPGWKYPVYQPASTRVSMSGPPEDPVEQALWYKKQAQISTNLDFYGSPEKATQANLLSRRSGVDVESAAQSWEFYNRNAAIADTALLAFNFPGAGEWLAGSSNAAAAVGDYENLSLLGKLWWGVEATADAVTQLPAYAATSVVSAVQPIGRGLTDLGAYAIYPLDWFQYNFAMTPDTMRKVGSPDEQLQRRLAFNRAGDDKAKELNAAAAPDTKSDTVDQIFQGVGSGIQSATWVGIGLATGGLGFAGAGTVATTGMAGNVGLNAFYEGLDQGLTPSGAIAYGIRQGGIEFVMEKLPVGQLVSAVKAGDPFFKTLFKQMVLEVPTEQVTTVLQDLDEWATLNPDKPFSTYLEERPAAAWDTFLSTVGSVGASTSISVGAGRAVDAAMKVSARVMSAESAIQEGRTLDRMVNVAGQSKLRADDKVGFGNFIQGMAEEKGQENVFVDGAALLEYMQSDSYEPLANDWLESWREDAVEAAAIGGDVVMPVGEVVANMPDNGMWAALGRDVRTSAGGMSRSEAEAFNEAMADIMDELADKMAESEKAAQQEAEPRQKLEQSITDKLMNAGFTPSAARAQAALLTQRVSTRAERMGRALTGMEFDNVGVNRVLPENLVKAREADNLEMTIAAMRRGKDPQVSRGKSLLEWIADRGGIEDRGGELAAMGADRWHLLDKPKKGVNKKGKAYTATTRPGRRKLLKDFVEGQGSMIGGASTANALDETLQAAISAGFFPELTTGEQVDFADQGYADLPDTQILLDAIADELAGNPIYADGAAPVMDDTRLAAQELDEILTSRGLDANQMTDQQIRDALDAYQAEQTDGQDYFDQMPDTRWSRLVDSILSGDRKSGLITIGETPAVLTDMGFPNGSLVMSAAKMVRARKEHDIPADVLYDLPSLIASPLAVFPSAKNDGSFVIATVGKDRDGNPIVVPVVVEQNNKNTVVLSVYGKNNSEKWLQKQIANAQSDGSKIYLGEGFATSMASKEARSSAPIAAEEVAKRDRPILSIRSAVKKQFDQRYSDGGPRGRILFPSSGFDNSATIELFKSSNLSTFLHETGHLWLEELRMDAMDPAAPQSLRDDWAQVAQWFADNGQAIGPDGSIPTEAHEMWARGVEQYLMEGKAPVEGLAKMFETFRQWLVSIYKTVQNLRTPMTPEIRGVMDRLIATDAEIEKAREAQFLGATFQSAADAGMTRTEFDAYQKAVESARLSSRDKMLGKVTGAIKKRLQKEHAEAKAEVMDEVTAEMEAMPLFRAIRAMEETPLDYGQLVERFGADAPSMMPRRVPPLVRKGGADLERIAEQSGFQSGDAMVRALVAMETDRKRLKEVGDNRPWRTVVIEQEVEMRLNERYGDVLADGTIEREAIAAVHNEEQGELLAMELRALGRKTGQNATPYKIARDWARAKVRGGTVNEMTSQSAINRYRRAAEKAGRAAEQALAARDDAELFRQKQIQMVNSALMAEAKAAQDEVESALNRLQKVAKKRTMKSIDQDYLEQAQALLEAVDLRERSQASINRQGKWAEWAAQREAEGFDVVVPPQFEAVISQRNWSRLGVEELLGLDEAVKQIMHLGKLKQTLIDNKEAREFEAIVADAERAADEIGRKPPKDSFADPTTWDNVKARVADFDASLLKIEQVVDWLDNGKSDGVFNRMLFRPIADAQAKEQGMLKDYYKRIKDAFDAIPPATLRRWADKVDTGLVDRETGLPAAIPRHKMVAMALNWGNAGNRQRLADGYGWSEQGVEAVLMDNMTQEEWTFVQSVWDIVDSLWPDIAAMERRVNGVEPEKVEAVEVETPFGTLRGGYYPAIYDSTLNYRSEELSGSADELFSSGYVRSTTRASSTKERSEKVKRPILLDLGVINRHIGEVVHDITHREAIMRAHRFVTNERVQRAIDQTLSPEIRKQFRPWLAYVANSWAHDRAGNEGFAKWASKLRANTTFVGMGYRLTTIMMQVGGYANSFEYVGASWVTKAIAQVSASPVESYKFVMERSDEVRERMNNLDRDINAELARINRPGPARAIVDPLVAVKTFGFHGIGYMDRIVVIPTWLGAYNKALANGMDEADAAYEADKAVRLAQGSGSAKDLAAISRGTGKAGELLKFMTMFYTYMSAVYNRQRTLGRDTARAGAKDIPALVARAWWLVVVPPILSEMLSGRGPDEDEEWGWWAFKKMMAQSLGAIPFVRDVFTPAWDAITGTKGFDYSFTPAQRAGEVAVDLARNVGKAARGEETKKPVKNALEAAGYATGLVPGQFATSIQFWVDVGNGDAQPEDFGDFMEGTVKGKISEEE